MMLAVTAAAALLLLVSVALREGDPAPPRGEGADAFRPWAGDAAPDTTQRTI